MKKLFLGILILGLGASWLLFFALSQTPAERTPGQTPDPRPLYDRHDVDLGTTSLRMYSKDAEGAYYRTIAGLTRSLEAEGTELLFATNGGIFMENLTPLGLYIENGETLREINNVKEAYGNFYLQPNGIFYLQEGAGGVVETDAFETIENVQFATQSGPMLLMDGEMNPAFNHESENARIRSGVCFPFPEKAVFIISNRPVTFHAFAEQFLEAGCEDALYLDGVISDMYIKETNRLPLSFEYAIIIAATAP